jgi:3'(2'), 5'-bisphosphate nucleotidase
MGGTDLFSKAQPEVAFALESVRAATRLCREIRHETIAGAMVKPDRSPVTLADFASQAVIGRWLEIDFPDDTVVAEEDSAGLTGADGATMLDAVTTYVSRVHSDATSAAVCNWIDRGRGEVDRRFWVIDPIDGTKGFLRGGQYVIALALVERGEVVLGALGCPNLNQQLEPEIDGPGSMVIAVRGGGAWVTGLEGDAFARVHVSPEMNPTQARILRSYEATHTDPKKFDRLAAELGTNRPLTLMDSQAKYAVLAGGGAELLVRIYAPERSDYIENSWDHAAGVIIVEEAGGVVSDLDGAPLDFSHGAKMLENRGTLVSNGFLHDEVLGVLKRVEAEI